MMAGYSDVAQRVTTALVQNPRTSELVIDAIDDNGFLTLKGSVSSEEERQAVEEIARRQEGVIDVINELQVEQDETEVIPPPVVPPPQQQ